MEKKIILKNKKTGNTLILRKLDTMLPPEKKYTPPEPPAKKEYFKKAYV